MPDQKRHNSWLSRAVYKLSVKLILRKSLSWRRRGGQQMSLIRADDLEQWASSIVGRNKLGELVRRLIHASIPLESIRRIRFLSDEANQLAGWDGLLDCDSQVPWAPNGTSVWELGAGSNTREKIRTDFVDRLGRRE